MINANELRIGNWVSVKGKIIKVQAVDIDGINPDHRIQFSYSNVSIDTQYDGFFTTTLIIEPIPLTTEILEKCGFKKESDYWDINDIMPLGFENDILVFPIESDINASHMKIEVRW